MKEGTTNNDTENDDEKEMLTIRVFSSSLYTYINFTSVKEETSDNYDDDNDINDESISWKLGEISKSGRFPHRDTWMKSNEIDQVFGMETKKCTMVCKEIDAGKHCNGWKDAHG